MRIPIFTRTAALLALVLCSATATADGEARLRSFLADVRTLSADFQQLQRDESGAEQERASGILLMQQPGRFRWDYREPYEQLIVADGRRLWVYDADLEQVTVRGMQEALGNSPARLLSGELDLDADFTIHELPRSGGLEWLELRPRDAQEEFTVMRLGFAPRELRAMHMIDNLGNQTEIVFSNMKINPRIDPSMFSFVPPPGVDVVGE